ncbi:cation transporter [Roseibium aestuarii]|uniref:Cation transporter n=1 Tax=Roseibium aestuarii TaxID=2600299 RepID=A0ABW4JYD7_9HYPH|nr:cation transporter [Roseibium aestuarii]
MGACCGHDHSASFDGMNADYKRRLWAVIALNAGMFVVEMVAGQAAGSKALQADALDFFGDAMTYGISLAVIGSSLRIRSTAALAKGVSLLLMGLWVAGSTLWRVFTVGLPEAEVMGVVGMMALAANVASVLLLMRYKDGDANVRSVWLCSRNDAIGNVAVMIAALGVWGTASGWPDLIVAGIMAALFLSSAIQILARGWAEYRSPEGAGAASCAADHEHHEHGHAHTREPAHDHVHGHSH